MKSWIFILFMLFLASCKARCQKESDIKRTYVNQDLKDFFIFKKGTYWVYENQDGTKTDSIYVSDYGSTWTPIDDILCKQNERISYTWKSTGRHFLNQDSVIFHAQYNKIGVNSNEYLLFDGINFFSIHDNSPYINGDGEKLNSKYFISNSNLMINAKQYSGLYYGYKSPVRSNLFLEKHVGMLGWIQKLDTFNLKNYKLVR